MLWGCSYDGSAHGNDIFENWCVDGEGGDEAYDGDEQTENVTGNPAQYYENFKTEMTVGVMQWTILKETQL